MKKVFIFLILIPFYCNYSQQQGWQVVGNMKYPVAAGQVVFNEDQNQPKFYFLGGYSQYFFQNVVNWIQEYDVNNSTWRLFPFFMDKPRSLFVAGMWNSEIIYFGGIKDNSIESVDIFNEHEPAVFDTNNIFNRRNASGKIVGDNLIIVGGENSNAVQEFHFIVDYNLTTKKTTSTFDFLNYFDNTQDLMTVSMNGSIYIIGGLINNILTNTINRYDITSNKLFLLPIRTKSPRAGGVAVYNAYLNKIFIIGGYDELNSALSTVETISVDGQGVLKISDGIPLQYARKYPMAVCYKDKIYVFGGFNKYNEVVNKIEVYTDSVTTDVKDEELPKSFALMQNYPNPFNPTTNIKFDLPKESNVRLTVYNILGEQVATLVNGVLQAGHQEVKFDATKLASGMYIYRIEAGSFVQVKKMLLMK